MYSVYLLTGSNQGNRQEQLEHCIAALGRLAGTIRGSSSLYETEAWGVEGLPPHLNQAIHLVTTLEPLPLLAVLQQIEKDLGRVRQEKWGVRAIDIDIIYFGDQVIRLPQLVVPHPLMQQRNFVLAPLAGLAPDFIHPVLLKSNKELLLLSEDRLSAVPVS